MISVQLREGFVEIRIIVELCFGIARDCVETLCFKFPDPHQIELCLCGLTGKLSDDLSTAVALKRSCQGLDTLTSDDARAVEDTYRAVLEAPSGDVQNKPKTAGRLAERGLPEKEAAPLNGRTVAE